MHYIFVSVKTVCSGLCWALIKDAITSAEMFFRVEILDYSLTFLPSFFLHIIACISMAAEKGHCCVPKASQQPGLMMAGGLLHL